MLGSQASLKTWDMMGSQASLTWDMTGSQGSLTWDMTGSQASSTYFFRLFSFLIFCGYAISMKKYPAITTP